MIQLYEYKGSPIQYEVQNGQVMANATLMCKAFGKRFNDWMELKSTKEYIAALKKNLTTGKNGTSENQNITFTGKNGKFENQLVTTKTGQAINGGGSWISDRLIIPLTRWLEVEFAIWSDDRVAELMRTGVTSIDGNLAKVIDALAGLAGVVTTLRSEVNELKKAKAMQKIETQHLDVIDARHRKFYITERNGEQIRCIKLEDMEWFTMADVLLILKCRTSPQQYARALNRNGVVNAQKIWLFGQSREQWFVNENGLNLLMSRA